MGTEWLSRSNSIGADIDGVVRGYGVGSEVRNLGSIPGLDTTDFFLMKKRSQLSVRLKERSS